jgi:amidase
MSTNETVTDKFVAHQDQVELINSFNSPLTDEKSCSAARELKRLAGSDGMGKFMAQNDLDLIVSSSDCSLVSFAACAGWPSGTVPLGRLENGLPYGMFVLARVGEDERIFQFMSAFEKMIEKIGLPVLRDF